MIWKKEHSDSRWLCAPFSPINRCLFFLFSFLPFLFFFFLERKFIKVCVLEGELSGRSWGGEIIWTKYKIKIKDYLLLATNIVGSEFPSSSSSSESHKSLFSWAERKVRFVTRPGKCLKLINNTQCYGLSPLPCLVSDLLEWRVEWRVAELRYRLESISKSLRRHCWCGYERLLKGLADRGGMRLNVGSSIQWTGFQTKGKLNEARPAAASVSLSPLPEWEYSLAGCLALQPAMPLWACWTTHASHKPG